MCLDGNPFATKAESIEYDELLSRLNKLNEEEIMRLIMLRRQFLSSMMGIGSVGKIGKRSEMGSWIGTELMKLIPTYQHH